MEGKRFNAWIVLEEHNNNKPGKWYRVQCNCGNIRIKKGTDLRAGKGKQCQECQYKNLYDPTREINKKYGKWKIIEFIDIHRKLMRFKVQCECGQESLHCVADLRSGKSQQCMLCHNRENAKQNTKHGMHNTHLYKVWTSMIQRCKNPNSSVFYRYGARGIKICDRWLKFENFLEDMGDRPAGLTIDRIDNDGNYEPSNCRWVTHKENCNNRSSILQKRSRVSELK